MRRVLFIGITEYDFANESPHLRKKFMGLSEGMKVFVVARGKPFHKQIWGADFYLIPTRLFFLPLSFVFGGYLCVSRKIDVLVCQTPLTEGIVGVLLKFLLRKELIVEIHGDWLEGPFINKKRLFAPFLRSIVPHIGSWTIKNADKVRTLTRIAQEELRAKFPRKKYFSFPTFTDIDIFLEEKNTSFKKYICTVAVLSPIKDIETLIEAFGQIRKKFPEFKLVIAGEGPSMENLKSKTEKERLESAVIFTGRLSSNEVKEVVKDCYAFVLPSLSEGFGRVFIEAMALGKPVIATRVGGVPEIVKDGENGFLIEPKDVNTLVEKLRYLIENPSAATRMGEEGLKFVRRNFSNEKYIKNYIDMINA